MTKLYEYHRLNNITFCFKLDLNPDNNEYEPHIWIRHCVEPYQAVVAYLNISEQTFNNIHDRYEAYSKTDDITIYYKNLNIDRTRILIITAMKGYRL